MRPFPIKLNYNLVPDIAKIHRYLYCDFYSKCLNKSIKKNWKTFSCVECGIFKKHKKEISKNGNSQKNLLE